MLTWIVLWVQLRSATLLEELKASTGSHVRVWPAIFRALSRARYGAHPRQLDARSQFSPKGFGGQFRSARALFVRADQSLTIQDRWEQVRYGKLPVISRRSARHALLSGSIACSGVTCRT